jgi:hypothetical protein
LTSQNRRWSTREFVLAPKNQDERHRIVLDLDACVNASLSLRLLTGEIIRVRNPWRNRSRASR